MRQAFPFGVAFLIIASGILTAISSLPLFNLPPGSVRGQNFMPVTGQAIVLFALPFVVFGIGLVVVGVVFLAIPRWRMILGFVALALSAVSLFGSSLGSTSVVVIASIMGASAGLLVLFSRSLNTPESMRSGTWGRWLKVFPFVLTGVGVWEFGGVFLGCGPPNGIGTGACDLLGPGFYMISTLVAGALFALLAALLLQALHLNGSRT